MLAGNDYLQLICEILIPENCSYRGDLEKISRVSKITLSSLDLELIWGKIFELYFQVHSKENQELKYTNKESTHTKAAFQGIMNRFFIRPYKISPISSRKLNWRIN